MISNKTNKRRNVFYTRLNAVVKSFSVDKSNTNDSKTRCSRSTEINNDKSNGNRKESEGSYPQVVLSSDGMKIFVQNFKIMFITLLTQSLYTTYYLIINTNIFRFKNQNWRR